LRLSWCYATAINRGTACLNSACHGQSLTIGVVNHQWQHRVVAAHLLIVEFFTAQRNLADTLAHHGGHVRLDELSLARINDLRG